MKWFNRAEHFSSLGKYCGREGENKNKKTSGGGAAFRTGLRTAAEVSHRPLHKSPSHRKSRVNHHTTTIRPSALTVTVLLLKIFFMPTRMPDTMLTLSDADMWGAHIHVYWVSGANHEWSSLSASQAHNLVCRLSCVVRLGVHGPRSSASRPPSSQ